MTVPQEITQELQKVAPSAIIELFELRLVAALHGSADVYRFHAGVNGKNDGGNVVWAGQTFTAFPVECDGFEYSGNGQLPRPKLRVANVLSTITTVLLAVNAITPGNDLIGAKVIRRRTLARYLDAVNFPGNVNPYGTPDPTAEFPQEIYYISRKVTENRDVVEFELAAAFDLQGVRAPKRQCIANVCQWTYKSAECGYSPTGAAVKPLRNHYVNFGYNEGRNINSSGQFNASYYLSIYADVVAAGYTVATANQHFRNYGIWEGRSGNAGGQFNAAYYLSTYPDLNVIVYFNDNDVGVSSEAQDVCGKRVNSCKLRFGNDFPLPFGSFPGIGSYTL
jgi:lambda family phage minor tail protein L